VRYVRSERCWLAFLDFDFHETGDNMPDTPDLPEIPDTTDAKLTAPVTAAAEQHADHDAMDLDDQEKILAGSFDVNYPALLTKDVAGG
jgi:hypothetical protein